jgi:hypothetical protein
MNLEADEDRSKSVSIELEDGSLPGESREKFGDKSIASDLNLKYRNGKAGSSLINPSMSINQTKSIEFLEGKNSKPVSNRKSGNVSQRSNSRDPTPKSGNEPK